MSFSEFFSADHLAHLIYITLLAAVWLFCAAVVVILAWVLISVVPFLVRRGLELIGLKTVFSGARLFRLRRLLYGPVKAYHWASSCWPLLEKEPSVYVVIDERLKALAEAIVRSRIAVEQACDKIALFGQRGSAALLKDVNDLEQKTLEAARLGGEIDEGLVTDYQTRNSGTTNLIIGTFFLLVFAIGNGAFMNQFMQALIPSYFFGIPVSLILSIIIIAFEAGAGWLIAISTQHGARKWNVPLFVLGTLCVLVFAFIEAALVGVMHAAIIGQR